LQVPGLYDGSSLFHPVRGRSFDDSDPYISSNKQTGRAPGLPDNILLKSFAVDKEKTSSVAKIKVVVCFSFLFHLVYFYLLTAPFFFLNTMLTQLCELW
jgi:hypothetical protein